LPNDAVQTELPSSRKTHLARSLNTAF